MAYTLRPVDPGECDLIYRWRNHPRVRAVMPFSGEIDPAFHLQWWPNALADPARRMLILEEDSTPLAVVVFLEVQPGRSASWGLYTAPHEEISHAKALAAWIACDYAGLRYAFEVLGVETLRCEIVETHSAALKIRDRMGFKRTGSAAPPFVAMEFTAAQYRAAEWPHPFRRRGSVQIRSDKRDQV